MGGTFSRQFSHDFGALESVVRRRAADSIAARPSGASTLARRGLRGGAGRCRAPKNRSSHIMMGRLACANGLPRTARRKSRSGGPRLPFALSSTLTSSATPRSP
jgi:hypothetical protein